VVDIKPEEAAFGIPVPWRMEISARWIYSFKAYKGNRK
jgi:hypothetical protein